MYPEKPNNTKQKVTVSLVALVVIALLVLGVTSSNSQQDSQSIATTPTTSATTTATSVDTGSSNTTTSSSYKDGTYASSSSYYVPHGSEIIKVTLTVKDGAIIDSTIENSEGDRQSARFQEEFTAVYKSQVVGKSIAGLQLSYVAGASDTTRGFNDALDQIRSQAQA